MTYSFAPRRVFGFTLLGVLLIQAAWILTMPTYRGIDEFDHVYKAAAVARGEFRSHEPAKSGRGVLVRIPGSIVDAASTVCSSYRYTGHDNCSAAMTFPDGTVDVATAAGAYNPAYYVVVGTLARPFGGNGADYAMRVATALICALLIAWAASILTRLSRTRWPFVCFLVGLTPVLTYSTSIATPNGVSYAAAALTWVAALELVMLRTVRTGLAVALTVGAAVLLMTHTTGALWVALTGLVCLVLIPVPDLWSAIRQRPRLSFASAVVVIVVAAFCTIWVRLEHTNTTGGLTATDVPRLTAGYLSQFNVVWLLQQIAVFPTRTERAPVGVYVIWALPLLAILVAVYRFGSTRERIAGSLILVLLVAVPTIFTIRTYDAIGLSWQGRYALPLSFGLPLIVGLALDRRGIRVSDLWHHVLASGLAVATAWSTVYVGVREVHHGPTDPAAGNLSGGFVLVAILAAAGVFAVSQASRGRIARTAPELGRERELAS